MECAHRISYQLNIGPIPDDLCVCHRCDNPACINPDHLFLGTKKDNSQDCIDKGRWPDRKGSVNGRAKLTEAQIEEVRNASGSQSAIAARFGVNQQVVSRIKLKQAWRHV